MPGVTVTSEEAAKCLEAIKKAGGWISAAEIAWRLRLGGGRETQRRHVRAIVEELRKDGSMIVASRDGYYLTDSPATWRDYLECRQRDARRVLGQTHRRRKGMITDRAGQGYLFGPKVTVGIG